MVCTENHVIMHFYALYGRRISVDEAIKYESEKKINH